VQVRLALMPKSQQKRPASLPPDIEKPTLDRRKFVKHLGGTALGTAIATSGFERMLDSRQFELPILFDSDNQSETEAQSPYLPRLTPETPLTESGELAGQRMHDAVKYVSMRVENLPAIYLQNPKSVAARIQINTDSEGYARAEVADADREVDEFIVYLTETDLDLRKGIRLPAQNGVLSLARDLEMQALCNGGMFQFHAIQAVKNIDGQLTEVLWISLTSQTLKI